MPKRTRDDEIEKSRRLITNLRGDTIDKRLTFDNLTTKKQTENPDGGNQIIKIDNESITVETRIDIFGVTEDGTEELIDTEVRKVTYDGRELITNILNGTAGETITEAKVGDSYDTDRRQKSSINNVIKKSDTFNTTINNGKLEITTEFNDLDTESNDTKEIGIFTDKGTLLQYNEVPIDYV